MSNSGDVLAQTASGEGAAFSFDGPPVVAIAGDREIGGPDTVRAYLNRIGKIDLLTAEQEVELAKRIEAGLFAGQVLDWLDDDKHQSVVDTLQRHRDKPAGKPGHITAKDVDDFERVAESFRGDKAGRGLLAVVQKEGDRAKNRFMEANLRLVVSIAKRYVRDGESMTLMDLIQEGNAGLDRAVGKFNYVKGFKFSTYSTWWIRQAISRAKADQEDMIRLPMHIVEDITKLEKARREFLIELEREPDAEELSAATGFTEEQVVDLLLYAQGHVSLDVEAGGDKGTIDASSLGSYIPDRKPGTEELALEAIRRREIEGLLQVIDSERDRAIMRARFGFHDGREHTFTELAEEFNLSRERIRQIEVNCLGKLKAAALRRGIEA